MFRGWNSSVCHADHHPSKRRKRRCLPTLSGSASCLEDRVLLSGASAHAAEVAKTAVNLASTHAGQVVTGLYQSILGTDPTSAQLTTWVHKLRSGVSSKVLRKDLIATARTEQFQPSAAGVNAIDVTSETPTSTLSSSSSSSVATTSSSAMAPSSSRVTVALFPLTANLSLFARTSPPIVNTLPVATNLAGVGLDVQQAPDMSAMRAGTVGGSSSPIGISLGGGKRGSTTTTSSTSTSSTTSSTSTSSSASPLQSILTTGTVPTSGLTTTTTTTPGTISSLGQLSLSSLSVSQSSLSQLTVTPALSSSTIPSAPQTGLTTAPQTGLTTAPQTGLTTAPTVDLI